MAGALPWWSRRRRGCGTLGNRSTRRKGLGSMSATPHTIASIEQLETIYKDPAEPAIVKETSYVTPEYGALIAASPFVALATSGPEGLDCSPRGDLAGFVRVHDPKTLMLPDRRGNNRVDSLRNIVRDPRVG